MKAFADDKDVTQNTEISFRKSRKQCGKRRKCLLLAFSSFPRMFLKGYFLRVVKSRVCSYSCSPNFFSFEAFESHTNHTVLPVRSCVTFKFTKFWTEKCSWEWLVHRDPLYVYSLLHRYSFGHIGNRQYVKIVGKGEIARKRAISPLPTMFSTQSDNCIPFTSHSNFGLFHFSSEQKYDVKNMDK